MIVMGRGKNSINVTNVNDISIELEVVDVEKERRATILLSLEQSLELIAKLAVVLKTF